MQNQAAKNNLSIYAHLQDVEALLYQTKNKFVAKAFPTPKAELSGVNIYTDYLPLVATVFIRDNQVNEEGELRFLSMDVADKKLLLAKLQYDPIGLMVPDVCVVDMTDGLNKDCHINPDNTLRVDTLQLIRGVVQSCNAYMKETTAIALMDEVLARGGCFNFLQPTADGLHKKGCINVNLITRLEPVALDELVQTLNANPHLNPQAQFSIKTLHRQDYPTTAVTLN